jgi:hypothetical protein
MNCEWGKILKLYFKPLLQYVLRRICGPKRGEKIGGWVKLHNEELHNLYCSSNIIRTIQ